MQPNWPGDPKAPSSSGPEDAAASWDGLAALDDEGLLARYLRRGLSWSASQRVAADLLRRFDGMSGLAAADAVELARTEDLDPEAVRDLRLLWAMSVRVSRATASRRPVLSSWTAVVTYARTALAGLPREQFRTLYLDRRNFLIRDEFVAEGSVDHAPVYPKEIIRRGLELSASALILVHNHPSGDPTPSRADIEMTRRIVEAAKVFDLQVHDHIVVGRGGTASFRTLGLL